MTSEPFRRQLAEYEAVAAAWAVNRMERGRDLPEHEIAVWLADRQTPIRHGTADIAVEIADQLRTALAAEKERVARLRTAIADLFGSVAGAPERALALLAETADTADTADTALAEPQL